MPCDSLISLSFSATGTSLHISEDEEHNGPEYESPTSLYEYKVTKGILKRDPKQEFILKKLQDLHSQLASYEPVPPPERGFFSKVFNKF